MATANYSAPPIPPRPYSRPSPPPQPIPPLPPGFTRSANNEAPHHLNLSFRAESPLAAPRPQRLDPDLPADMARTLDEQLAYNGPPLASPQPPQHGSPNTSVNHAPGFVFPSAPSPPSYYGPPPMSDAGTPMLPMLQIQADDGGLSSSMGGLSLNCGYGASPRQRAASTASPMFPVPQMDGASRQRTHSMEALPSGYEPSHFPAPEPPQSPPQFSAPSPGTPALTAPLPTVASLRAALPAIQARMADVSSRVAWIRDVLLVVSRATVVANKRPPTSVDPAVGPIRVTDATLQQLVDVALPLLIDLILGAPQQGQQLTAPLAEALHIRASLTSTGAFPSFLPQNQRTAFREFEAAARSGYSPASWFRLGRDYESFNDVKHAVDCYDRGARAGDESCLYRLGMANLLGQLGMPQDFGKALPVLQKAAAAATISVPQPAYVYALILLGDISALPLSAPISSHVINALVPPGSSALLEARKHLERAAYLHFTPAQYKLGHAYEFAEQPFPFDALLSVQYYSLASQAGEPEADLALSRWFLCGSEGTGRGDGFKKDENLAFIFGEKAAKKGLPSAEFAMGYYNEVGVGTAAPDVQKAMHWYEFAASHGNNDAVQRLNDLKKESAHALTRQEHEVITETKLVRGRTQAQQRSEALGQSVHSSVRRCDANQVVESIRKNTLMPTARPHPRQSSLAATGQPSGHQSPPPMPAMPSMPGSISQDPAQRLRDRPRYSLADSGPHSSSPPPGGSHRVGSGRGTGGRIPSGTNTQGSFVRPNVPSQNQPNMPPAPASQSPKPSATKYQTFADMGVQGGRAEDKDCVIM